ncbi:MAG: hypothetical protein LBE48_03365 [Methanomassiliicoccaceae archaeon]|jgi:hypothetical protein|nr:hypothetical protein [Methanomassiliicoccaceae archaeon]
MGRETFAGVIALIGGIIAIVSLFLEWTLFGYTGLEIFQNGNEDSMMIYMPIAAAALGAVAVLVGGLVLGGKGGAGTRVLLFIAGIGIFLAPILLITDAFDYSDILKVLENLAGTGIYLTLVAGLLVFIGAVAPNKHK